MSLENYANIHSARRGTECATCILFKKKPDLAKEIRDARKSSEPRSFRVISGYLAADHKVVIKGAAISEHFREHEKETGK